MKFTSEQSRGSENFKHGASDINMMLSDNPNPKYQNPVYTNAGYAE
jgi:hypothetical protein